MHVVQSTELTVQLKRRRERDQADEGIRFSGYDILWPDGQPVGVGMQRFCHQGTRLLLGRSNDSEATMVTVRLYPVDGLDAPLTKPGGAVRCRRFFTRWREDGIRLYFFTGTSTEVVFDPTRDEPRVLDWLQVERMRWDEPFWFDLASFNALA